MIGIVPQKAVLFKGTIRHNMQWRDKNATDDDIWNALDIAQAKDFVEKKPDKLDEMILQEGKTSQAVSVKDLPLQEHWLVILRYSFLTTQPPPLTLPQMQD